MDEENFESGRESFDPTKILKRCWSCASPHTVLVRKSGEGDLTHNKIGACTNRECFRFSNISLIPSWVRV